MPDDLLYVNNFKKPEEPLFLSLPLGKGRLLSDGLDRLINMLKTNIPELLQSQFFRRKQSIVDNQQRKAKVLQKFNDLVSTEGFAVIQVQMGLFTRPDLLPVIEGQPTPFNKLEALVKEDKFPKKKLEELKKKYSQLTDQLEKVISQLKAIDDETQLLLKNQEIEVCSPADQRWIE